MYCVKCGRELQENENFCMNCGTPVEMSAQGSAASVETSVQGSAADYSVGDISYNIRNNARRNLTELGRSKNLFFITLALVILNWILAFTQTFKVSAELLGFSENGTWSSIGDVWYLWIWGFITEAVFLCLPLFTGKKFKSSYLIPAKIVNILEIAWLVFDYAVNIPDIKKASDGGMNAKLSMTVTGWLFVIVVLASIALMFKLSYDLKKKPLK